MKKIYSGLADQMTPENHLVRQLDKTLDFSYINNEVGEYCHPGITYLIDPVFIARYMLLIHLFYLDRPIKANITIGQHIDDQMQSNATYRWFLKSELGEPMPSYDRVMQAKQVFGGAEKWDAIFNCLLRQCADNGLPYKKNGAWDNIDTR